MMEMINNFKSALEPSSNFWHHRYMDNFYNNVATCELLLQHRSRAGGTIRIKRSSFTLCLKSAKLARGAFVFGLRQNILSQCWQSKKTCLRDFSHTYTDTYRITRCVSYQNMGEKGCNVFHQLCTI